MRSAVSSPLRSIRSWRRRLGARLRRAVALVGVAGFGAGSAAAGADSGAPVGDAVCASCHQDKVASYHETAHARTSSWPTAGSIHGKFTAGANLLRTASPNLQFVMTANVGGFAQTARLRTAGGEILERTEPFGVVIGSGRKGQTYLFWDGDRLFQLPVSYWTALDEWVNSPGYVDGEANFERPIAPRCLECHATSFASREPPENRYLKASLVLGLACEKCHGPGAEHVARYRSATPPATPADAAIVNPTRLPRARQLDACALCHEGIGRSLTPPLSYRPGEVLAHALVFPKLDPKAPIDVHASQVQLLERSRCFRASPTMTCSTCHDVHAPQRDAASFVATCLNCHQATSCGTFPKLGHRIDGQCIACHMPLQETAQIVISSVNGRVLQPSVRNHRIAIYPEVSLP
jgi:hypothetical protein